MSVRSPKMQGKPRVDGVMTALNRANAARKAAGLPLGKPKGVKNSLTAARVEEELRRIATIDPLELWERQQRADKRTAAQGGVGGSRTVWTLRAIEDMPKELRACIASIKVRQENLVGGDGHQDVTVEVKFWDKLKALELCAKHFGWVTDKVTVVMGQDVMDALEAGRTRNAALRAARPFPALPPLPVVTAVPIVAEAAPATLDVFGERDVE